MPKAGPDKRLCGAQLPNKPAGVTCHNVAGFRTDHVGFGCCYRHGGRTGSHGTSVQREQAEAAVAVLGLPRDVDPHTALLEEVHRTAGHVGALQLIVGELEQDALVFGVTKTVLLPNGGERVETAAALSAWLRLYQSERKHLLDACNTAIRCGVEQKRVELEQQHGELLADLFRRVFADPELELTPAQRRLGMVSAAKQLRLVAG